MRARLPLASIAALVLIAPILGGAEKGGCGSGPAFSMTPAPDMEGEWAIAYDDRLDVEITIGGAVYTEEIGVEGGAFTIDHDGMPLTFDLSCERPEVVCPSEGWPESVSITQRNATYPHRMWVNIPRQSCDGALVAPEPSECGAGTNNPDCDMVCDGEITTRETEHFGVIDEAGESFDLLLGAGIATNGINCAMLGVSSAHADIVSSGTPGEEDWTAEEMTSGEVVVAYAGGCLWAGDPDMDAELEALLLSASVKFTTGFTGARAP